MAKNIVSDKQTKYERGDGRLENISATGGLLAANNLSDVDSAATALANLGGLASANNLSDLASASAARTNLGLGAVATESYISGQYLATAVYAPASIVQIDTLSNTMASLNAAATTVASGSNGGEISNIGAWSSPSAGVLDVASTAGWPSAGTISVATSTTPAVVTYTGTTAASLTGCAYVSGSATGTVSTGGAVTLTAAGAGAVAVPAISTGSFTATSTEVIVTASLVCGINNTGDQIGFGLAAHGTLTPMAGNSVCIKQGLSGASLPVVLQFLVTGLTAGNSYNYDLMFCAAGGGAATVYAIAQTTATPLASGPGAPVVLTVQAV
jgi:hypothetical protein